MVDAVIVIELFGISGVVDSGTAITRQTSPFAHTGNQYPSAWTNSVKSGASNDPDLITLTTRSVDMQSKARR